MKKKEYILTGLAVLALLALFIYPRLGQKSYNGSVPCLVPDLPLALHIHPHLTIFVDGIQQTVPTDIGLNGSCERALHTHDTSGTLHVEAQAVRDYVLDDFLDVWGETIQKDGYNLEMKVDGAPSQEFGNLLLKDKQEIILTYTKKV